MQTTQGIRTEADTLFIIEKEFSMVGIRLQEFCAVMTNFHNVGPTQNNPDLSTIDLEKITCLEAAIDNPQNPY